MPRVACLWFPTLPIDRLRWHRLCPEAGPLVTAAAERGRRVVVACSREAGAAGLRPGMPLAEARVRVEGLAVAEADPAADAAWLRRLALLAARRWTPTVAIDGHDGLLLDIGGAAHLAGGEDALLARAAAVAGARGLAMRGAVAGSVGAAWAVAHGGAGALVVVPPGGDEAAIAPLPPSALRLDAGAHARLERLGFATIAAILAAPRSPLSRRIGGGLALRLDQALGRRSEPITALVPPRTIVAHRTLAEPIAGAEAILIVIRALADELCATLAAAGRGATRATLECVRVDAHTQSVTVGCAQASRDPDHLADLLGRKIERIDPGFGIEAMRLRADVTQPVAAVQGAADVAEPERASNVIALSPRGRGSGEGGRASASVLYLGTVRERSGFACRSPSPQATPPWGEGEGRLVDRLANRFGAVLCRLAPAESDIPARMAVRIPALAPPDGLSWRGDWPRPVRLLRRPEPVEHAIAGLPDHAPVTFSWRGRRHSVVAADGPERVLGEWWRGGDRHRSRDYFQVELADGGRYWLFRRGDGGDSASGPGDWFVHGAFG